MAVVSLAEHGHLNCYQANTQGSTYGMLGHLPVCFRDQPTAIKFNPLTLDMDTYVLVHPLCKI